MNGFSAIDINASGMSAEALRMEVAANNIANANTTITQSGGPFRRMEVIVAAASEDAPNGVQIVGVEPDETPFDYEPLAGERDRYANRNKQTLVVFDIV